MKNIRLLILVLFISLVAVGCGTAEAPDNTLIGSTAPDFNLENALGGQTSLADFQGEPVLLYFHMAVG